jgi:two-component system, OmpR family, response regulator
MSDSEILLLDDDSDIVKVFSLALEKANLKVTGFTSPKAALEHYLQNSAKIGLVISDIRMPEMNGFEFAYNVRAKNPEAKVLLITAYEHGDLETAGIYSAPQLQIDEFLKKPISTANLVAAAMRHLSLTTQRG